MYNILLHFLLHDILFLLVFEEYTYIHIIEF